MAELEPHLTQLFIDNEVSVLHLGMATYAEPSLVRIHPELEDVCGHLNIFMAPQN